MPDGSWIAEARDSYDRVAHRYADLVRPGLDPFPLESALLGLFGDRVAEAGQGLVVDVGCGPGFLTHRLASRGLEVLGVDLSAEMVRLARGHSPTSGFVRASVTQLPLVDGAAAGVLCWYVLHHVPDQDLGAVVAELARVTAPGGSLMLGGHVGQSTYVKTEGYGGLPMRVLFARRSPGTYAQLLREAGLELDATIALGPDHPATAAVWLAHKPA